LWFFELSVLYKCVPVVCIHPPLLYVENQSILQTKEIVSMLNYTTAHAVSYIFHNIVIFSCVQSKRMSLFVYISVFVALMLLVRHLDGHPVCTEELSGKRDLSPRANFRVLGGIGTIDWHTQIVWNIDVLADYRTFL